MKLKLYPLFFLLVLSSMSARGQQYLFYNHYFANPFLYNPSFVAPNGYAELYLNYRKQWSGIPGAPTTGTLNLQLPLNYKTGIAFTAYQDEAGLLKTTTGLITFAYQVYLGRTITDIHKIGFGLSAGMTNSRIDADKAADQNDPVLASNTSSLDGQFGVHYQYKNFKLGFAIPRLFRYTAVSDQSFNKPGIHQINNTISSISYNFNFGKLSFEPIVTYRTFLQLPSQYEALGVLRYNDLLWVGGSYRQDYGAATFFGFNIKGRIKVGYAYEFATKQTDKFGDGTHEAQLIFRIGKKQFTRPQIVVKNAAETTTPPAVAETQKPTQEPVAEENPQKEKEEIAPTNSVTPPVVSDTPAKTTPQQQQEEATAEKEPVKTIKTLSGEGLAPGHYVVVGSFRSMANAKSYASTLKRAGYPASVAYNPATGYYIVHMTNASTIEEAKELRTKYRQMSRYSFRDTWILSVE
jgi:type IX secretion system PorP/SprF family membrane protein